MYSFETSRLRGISDMIIENGKLICANKPNDNIFIIKQSTGKESGFVFYDKRDSNNIYICHIDCLLVKTDNKLQKSWQQV